MSNGVSVHLAGDTVKAAQYMPLAVQLTQQLKAVVGPTGTRNSTYKLPNVSIECRCLVGCLSVLITAEGGCTLNMETGKVDMKAVAPYHPDFYESGTIYVPPGLPATLNWSVKDPAPAPGPEGPLTTLDTSRSMGFDLSKLAAAEQARLLPDYKQALLVKKIAAAMAPASNYSGKTRLFVQAIYGRPLEPGSKPYMMVDASLSRPPVLQLNYGADPDGYELNLFISSNSGIFKTTNGGYWHVEAAVPHFVLTRLDASECGDKLAKYLLSPEGSALPDEQKDIIEAFILSDITPSNIARFEFTSTTITGSTYNLGYGYHFNWDGNKADVINTSFVETGGNTFKYRSQHFRVTLAYNADLKFSNEVSERDQEKARWSVTQSIVEDAEWKAPKWQQVIASPDWTNGQLEIFGALWHNYLFGDAPIYCFYKRNALKVVRAAHSDTSDTTIHWEATSGPSYFAGEASGSGSGGQHPCGEYITLGSESGTARYEQWLGNPYTASFDVDGAMVTESARTSGGNVVTMGGKNISGHSLYAAGQIYYEDVMIIEGDATIILGNHGCYASLTLPDASGHGAGTSDTYATHYSFSTTSSTFTHSEGYELLCVIPFYDCEAVYLWSRSYAEERHSGTSGSFSYTDVYGPYFRTEGFRAWDAAPGGSPGNPLNTPYGFCPLGTDPYDDFWGRYSDPKCVFVGSAGTSDASFPVASAFFAGEPVTHVAQNFATFTSAVFKDCRGFGAVEFAPSGYPVNPEKPYTFVGGA